MTGPRPSSSRSSCPNEKRRKPALERFRRALPFQRSVEDFEEALRRIAVPYKIVGGYSFMDLKEVRTCSPTGGSSSIRRRRLASAGPELALPRCRKSSIEALGDHAFAQHIPFFDALDEAPGGQLLAARRERVDFASSSRA